jgi:hypothetical protein
MHSLDVLLQRRAAAYELCMCMRMLLARGSGPEAGVYSLRWLFPYQAAFDSCNMQRTLWLLMTVQYAEEPMVGPAASKVRGSL